MKYAEANEDQSLWKASADTSDLMPEEIRWRRGCVVREDGGRRNEIEAVLECETRLNTPSQ